MHIFKWAVLLSAFWLLLSGYIQPLLLSFGAVSVIIVLFVLKRMDEVDEEPQEIGTGLRLIRYIPWLIGQIIGSSAHVTKLIWTSSNKVSPSLAKIDIKEIPPSNHVLYANSITLTPGTLSVDLEDGELTVHALQKSSLEELEQGAMENKIAGIWGNNK
ncbi:MULTISPECIES: Na+/H+ antiporter subunit E [unclassified Oleiphilus]|uniref:Na+/H+ antiporter subunit E n=3 Tax=Oleiphilus TaxID=141450 RepID=UPI0007C296EA|nr:MULTISPECIES: Na+/H+ antiporter subunit E [unclassified Oleiphilus]KZY46938.1 hypothetical protein A3732_07145 [Oleiphilus sp. HI0050]KZY74365.1 hypothetical protein A3740_16720 [Oleiphilus sp. HI0068]KZY81092.1 hypothetical protein A3741_17835 [Oleiphilus sp. HI0069]KZY84980.1 hypothetical protein A3743_03630 [Oleiphilus sp. HI0072]KZZ28859.1 hypothetical protein A3752_03505 [Oleiphilus sp. HI0081]KZZ32668.1 hypothetical protein A3755_09295 [Oleiphilus sp. HI0085]